MAVRKRTAPRKAPISQRGVQGWIIENLFSSPFNTLLTLFGAYLIYITIPPFLKWALLDAHISGCTKAACAGDGACWVFIKEKIDMFIYGFYPVEELYRPRIVMASFAVSILFFVAVKGFVRAKITLFVLFPFFAYTLLHGGIAGLETVPSDKWGGLLLTLIISTVGIAASFPIGLMLALGRRSGLPLIKAVSTVYIEFVRGVPLITVLFMSSVLLPLFFPEGVTFEKLLRALIGVSLFEAAYVAENIRGGFAAIPRGQYEAADAMGLGYWQKMALVILPQALKVAVPNLVGSFISLFKDTSLVMIIGLFDLLSMVNVTANDRDWLGMETEGYVFAAAIFWIFTFSMSRYAASLEKRMKKGVGR